MTVWYVEETMSEQAAGPIKAPLWFELEIEPFEVLYPSPTPPAPSGPNNEARRPISVCEFVSPFQI
jgi:hypothetical protein